MLLKYIKKLLSSDQKKSRGLSLVEALVATAIMAIGFTGVYTMVTVSAQSVQQSVARQKMQIQANQILDIIESDSSNIDFYTMGLTNCTPPPGGTTLIYLIRGYEWCSRLSGEVGAATANDTRAITVTTLADQRRVVEVLLESNGGRVQVVMKRTFNGL